MSNIRIMLFVFFCPVRIQITSTKCRRSYYLCLLHVINGNTNQHCDSSCEKVSRHLPSLISALRARSLLRLLVSPLALLLNKWGLEDRLLPLYRGPQRWSFYLKCLHLECVACLNTCNSNKQLSGLKVEQLSNKTPTLCTTKNKNIDSLHLGLSLELIHTLLTMLYSVFITI